MKIFKGPRRSGKSTRALAWLQYGGPDEYRVLVTFSLQEAIRLRRICEKEGLDFNKDQIITPHQLQFVKYRQNVVVGIDELSHVLGTLLGVRVDFVTITEE